MRTGKLMISSFLGCDRMSRTTGSRLQTLAARSSCSSATVYGFGLAEGGSGVVRGAGVGVVAGETVAVSVCSGMLSARIAGERVANEITKAVGAGARADVGDRGRVPRGMGVRLRHPRTRVSRPPRAAQRRSAPHRRDSVRPPPLGSAPGGHPCP